MRRLFGRLLFAAFMVGQLQLIPATMACVREHRQPMTPHCASMMTGGGPSITSAPEATGTLCPLLGPCAPRSPAVTARSAAVMGTPIVSAPVPAFPAVFPPSFDSAPPAPPPEA